MQLTFRTVGEEETIALGTALAAVLRAGDVVALDGELGAGKTRLVRGIAEGIGINPAAVSSPTYVLVHEYAGMNPLSPPLIHVDAYRLAGPNDLDSIGWDRVLDGSGVVVIEWASRIASALAMEPSLAGIQIESTGATERRIVLLAPPAWGDRPGWRRIAALAESDGSMPGSGGGGGKGGAVRCPICGGKAGAEGRWSPFCSEKCRLVDLGKWLTGQYMLSRELQSEDLDDPDLEPRVPGE